jgi:FtsP/CotA-like multicopper oxidase with cupredoxin domain
MDIIYSSNGVLSATVNMFSAGLNDNGMQYGTETVYSGTGTSNNGNAGMYAFGYQFNDNTKGNSYRWGFPGTVLHLERGDTLKLNVWNWTAGATNNSTNAAFTVNFHYHGSHAPDLSQGDNVYVHHQVGDELETVIPIAPYENSVGLNWYHPHIHEQTKPQVQGGLAGFIAVGDPLDPWPQYKGKFKEVFMSFTEVNLQTNQYGRLQFFELATGDEYGTNYTKGWQKRINGQMNPIITMAPGETQIWDWGNIGARGGIMPVICDANLSNSWSNCTILARDGNSAFVHPLTAPLSPDLARAQDITSQSLLGPGNRTTWAITAPTNTGTYYLMDAWGGEESPNNVSGTNYLYVLATINVTGSQATNAMPVWTNQPADPLWAAKPDVYRSFYLEQQDFSYVDPANIGVIDNFYINQRKFGYGPISQMEIGSIEEWNIANGGPLNHPFHIHQGNFIVTKVGGISVNPTLPTPPFPSFAATAYVSPQDVVMIPAYSSVTVKFRVQNFPGKFVWHCHILEHEDEGMMSPIFQFGGREGIRLGLGASLHETLVLNGKGNVVSSINPFPDYYGPIVTASGIGTDTSELRLPNPLPQDPATANALYKMQTVKETLAVGTGAASARIKVYADGSTVPTAEFNAFTGPAAAYGVSVAVGGVSGSGAVRIAVGSRAPGPATVRLFDKNGVLVREFTNILPGSCPSGANVACGDVDYDNYDDIVVSAGAGREAIVTALSGRDIATGNSPTPLKCFTVVAGDPYSTEGAKVAVGYVALATTPSYIPNLVTTPEQGSDVGTVFVWNISNFATFSSMGGMSSGSAPQLPIQSLAEYRPFGGRAGAVNIATTYQTLPYGAAQPVIAAWQKSSEAAFTGFNQWNNVPSTQIRMWSEPPALTPPPAPAPAPPIKKKAPPKKAPLKKAPPKKAPPKKAPPKKAPPKKKK